MKSYVGLGIMHYPNALEVATEVNRLGCTVAKSLGNAGYLDEIAKQVPPTTKLIERCWWGVSGSGDNPDQFVTYTNPQDGVETWLNWVRGDIATLSISSHVNQFYVEGHNEIGNIRQYYDFEAARARTLRDRYGLKSVVLNTAVGNDRNWQWAKESGLLDAIRDTDSLIGYHGYAGMMINLWHGMAQAISSPNDYKLLKPPQWYRENRSILGPEVMDSWLTFRFVRDHETLKQMGYGDLKFVLTELGIDNAGRETYTLYTGGQGRRSWRTWGEDWSRLGFGNDPKQVYAEELKYAHDQMETYKDFCVGGAVFTYGSDPNSDWAAFDIRGTSVLDKYAALLVTDIPPKEPETPPVVIVEPPVVTPTEPIEEPPVVTPSVPPVVQPEIMQAFITAISNMSAMMVQLAVVLEKLTLLLDKMNKE